MRFAILKLISLGFLLLCFLNEEMDLNKNDFNLFAKSVRN
ncbi:Uncharacterised protein [Sphingobacterium daejeonense]|nr:Uncharacterised protein [Sphingobacterium daejeonense]